MALTAKAATTVRSSATKSQTIRGGSGSLENKFQVGGIGFKQLYTAIWDDSVDGHIPAAGSMGLNVFVPAGFVVSMVYFDVEVVPVGPTNMFISLENDADLTPSAAISGAPWSTTGFKHGAQVDAGAVNVALTVQPVVTTAIREIAIGGTVAASTAGRVCIWIEGFTRPAAVTQGAAAV